jgi:hypothetical protein
MSKKEINVSVKAELTGINKIRSELKSVKNELADALSMENVDPSKIDELQRRAGELKDQLKDVNEQVDLFAEGSKYKQITNNLSEIKGALFELDFDKVTSRVQTFNSTINSLNAKELNNQFKSMTEALGAMGGSVFAVSNKILDMGISMTKVSSSNWTKTLSSGISGLTNGLKTLGTGVVQLGKKFLILGSQLLINPIFLLATAIVGIVYAFWNFGDEIDNFLTNKLGPLGKYLKYLLMPISLLIDGLKALGKWLGLSGDEAKETKKEVKDLGAELEATHNKNSNRISEEIGWLELKTNRTKDENAKLKKLKIDLAKEDAKFFEEKTKLAMRELALDVAVGKVRAEEFLKRKAEIEDLRHQTVMAYQNIQKVTQDVNKGSYSNKKEPSEDPEVDYTLELNRMLEDIEDRAEQDAEERDLRIAKRKEERAMEDLLKTPQYLAATNEQKEILKKEHDDRIKLLQSELDNFEINKEKLKLEELSKLKDQFFITKEEKLLDEHKKEIELLNSFLSAELIDIETYNNKKLELEQKYQNNLKKLKGDEVDNEKSTQEAKSEAQQKILDAAFSSLNSLQGLMKEGSKSAKAFALADIAAKTAVGFIQGLDIAQKGAASTGPGAPYAFPIFYAQQIAAVLAAANQAKSILKSPGPTTSPPRGGGGGGGGGSTGVGQSVPRGMADINFQGGNNQNTLSASGGNINVVATVSEVEMTAVQMKNMNRQKNSEL